MGESASKESSEKASLRKVYLNDEKQPIYGRKRSWKSK